MLHLRDALAIFDGTGSRKSLVRFERINTSSILAPFGILTTDTSNPLLALYFSFSAFRNLVAGERHWC